MTESGKTTLAKKLAVALRSKRAGVLVLDPLSTQWDADYITADSDEFLARVWASQSCEVFIDEAGMAIGHYEKPMIELATKGRHWGHNCYFITQRGAMVSPSLRTQCRNLFAFNQGRDDGVTLARDWGYDELLEAHTLAQGEYFYARRFHGILRGNVFDQ